MRSAYHYRGEHLAHHLANRFAKVDLISITKMYDGPGTDPVWKKAVFGLRDLVYHRVRVIRTGNIINHVVRIPRLPAIVDYLFRDIWVYANLRELLNKHYDICILCDPRLAYVALRLKSLRKTRVLIYEDWDYLPGENPGIFWREIIGYREQICVRRADGVISVSSGLEKLRKQQGAKHTALVPNGVDYALFEKAQAKQPHPPTLVFMGSLSEAWGPDLPIQALPILRRSFPEIRYLMLGSGPDETKLLTLATRLGVEECVFFGGWQDYRRLPSFLVQADIGVATSRDTDFRKYACPLKIIEYMAAGLPVIGTPVGETQIIIEKSMAGATVEASPEAFAQAVSDLLTHRSQYERYAQNAIAFAQEHDWERLLDRELDFIKRLV